jgi:hypothetical protein
VRISLGVEPRRIQQLHASAAGKHQAFTSHVMQDPYGDLPDRPDRTRELLLVCLRNQSLPHLLLRGDVKKVPG